MNATDATQTIREGYSFDEPSIQLGVLIDEKPLPEIPIRFPLGMFNKHGLVAGATGTGKTKTLQVMAEALSAAGVPVFAADIKGDLSGMAAPSPGGEKLLRRIEEQAQPWQAQAFPCEFYALGGEGVGVPLRATITSFGPILLAKVLGLNEVQESSLGLVFYYADKHGLPLLDLEDLTSLLKFLISDDGKAELKGIGGVSSATVGVILRNLVTLEQQGGDVFFGEPQFEPSELLRTSPDGKGIVSLLELPQLSNRPALFSTFLMWLLAELFQELPEVGDPDKPKLVFFFDEAHLLFNDASKAFMDSITQTVRLIRSKGVGVFFVTQTPNDVPSDVLAQLGSRVQHQLRAHTPNDAKALRSTVATYPNSSYDLEQLLQSLGIGEAIVTVLGPEGAPTPVAHTRIFAPQSSMDPMPEDQLRDGVAKSALIATYGKTIDRESAHEILTRRAEEGAKAAESEQQTQASAKADRESKPAGKRHESESLLSKITDSRVFRDIARTASREFVRSIFGIGRRR